MVYRTLRIVLSVETMGSLNLSFDNAFWIFITMLSKTSKWRQCFIFMNILKEFNVNYKKIGKFWPHQLLQHHDIFKAFHEFLKPEILHLIWRSTIYSKMRSPYLNTSWTIFGIEKMYKRLVTNGIHKIMSHSILFNLSSNLILIWVGVFIEQ